MSIVARLVFVSIGGIYFHLDEDGNVGEHPLSVSPPATFSGNTITLTPTTVNIDMNGFGAQWSIGAIPGSHGGNGSVDLVPGITYRLVFVSIGGFYFLLDENGTVDESPLSVSPPAEFSADTVIVTTTKIEVDPGTYTGPWSIGAVAGSLSGLQEVAAAVSTTYILRTPTDGTIGSFFVDELGACSQTLFPFSGGAIELDCGFAVTNIPPNADAGNDQTVHVGASVSLDGSNSNDPDNNTPLTYDWNLLQSPAGSTAVLADAATSMPSLQPDVTGDYVITLVVTDALGAASTPDTVTVSTTNSAPTADAGPDQSITQIGTLVTLDGSGSDDADGDAITFDWAFDGLPAGSTATLSGANTAAPTFVADIHDDYTIGLMVTDSFGAVSASDNVIVSFGNVVPVADAGDNQSAFIGDAIELDGSNSSDGNLDSLTYRWVFASTPAGSAAILSSDTSAAAGFTADQAGAFVVSLTVNDGFVDSIADNVTVMVTSRADQVVQLIGDAIQAINGLAPSAFRNKNRARALTNKLNAVLGQVDESHYEEALSKLANDVAGKLDGCATGGAVDKNDWIRNCAAQGLVYRSVAGAIDALELITSP